MLSKLNYWLYSFTKCKISILVCFCYNINELSETQTPLMKKNLKSFFLFIKKVKFHFESQDGRTVLNLFEKCRCFLKSTFEGKYPNRIGGVA